MGTKQIIVQINPDTPPTGSDLSIVNAARRSFGKRSELEYIHEEGPHGKMLVQKLKDKDKRLLEFLARGMTAADFEAFVSDVPAPDTEEHRKELVELLWEWRNTPTHESPFGHAFFSFEVKLPVFLARQLVKHKFLRWSEYSRRYITDDVEFYQHSYREAAQDKKQGSGDVHRDSPIWERKVDAHSQYQLDLYNSMIASGVAPEQARGVLPQDLMTAVTWSGSLDAFANMCKLRLGSDAQKEAQWVAQEVYKHLKNQCSVAAPLLVEGVY
jgi:thymidylate synthase (FAD)